MFNSKRIKELEERVHVLESYFMGLDDKHIKKAIKYIKSLRPKRKYVKSGKYKKAK
jgi:hypothetical protein